MKVKAPAKINLALDILGKRPDGYHEMDMIMAGINVCDELDIEPSSDGKDHISCETLELPEKNTLSKTLDVLRKEAGLKGFYDVKLTKHTPDQAGLGGGSADAAALFKALCELESLDLPQDRQYELAAKIGADVPFCLYGHLARVQGIGQKVTPFASDLKLNVLLVKPEGGLSTPESFARHDALKLPALDIDGIQKALEANDEELLYSSMANALEVQAYGAMPVLEQIARDMKKQGIERSMMSGSGSCMMGFSHDKKVLEKACKALGPKYPFVTVTEVIF